MHPHSPTELICFFKVVADDRIYSIPEAAFTEELFDQLEMTEVWFSCDWKDL